MGPTLYLRGLCSAATLTFNTCRHFSLTAELCAVAVREDTSINCADGNGGTLPLTCSLVDTMWGPNDSFQLVRIYLQ